MSLCLSVPRRIPTLLQGPGCKSGEWYGVLSSRALLGGFAIGARVSLLWQHSAEREMSASACTRSMPGLLLCACYRRLGAAPFWCLRNTEVWLTEFTGICTETRDKQQPLFIEYSASKWKTEKDTYIMYGRRWKIHHTITLEYFVIFIICQLVMKIHVAYFECRSLGPRPDLNATNAW